MTDSIEPSDIDWEREAAETARIDLPSDEQIASIAELAQRQLNLEAEIEQDEADLDEKRERLKHLTTVVIPAALESLKMKGFTLVDGSRIEVEEQIYASITQQNNEDACDWLRANGFGDLIKNVLSMSFGMGEEERAAQIRATLTEAKASFDTKQGVHPSTLKAWASEQLEKNTALPEKLFGIHRVKVSTITAPKSKKARGKKRT